MTNEWVDLFENHGCRVARDEYDAPSGISGFDSIGPNTFLFSPHCMLEPFVEGLKTRPLGEVPLFAGDGEMMRNAVRGGQFRRFVGKEPDLAERDCQSYWTYNFQIDQKD